MAQTPHRRQPAPGCLARFLGSERADAGVEYALVIAAIATAVILGVELLANRSDAVFGRASSAMRTGPAEDRAAATGKGGPAAGWNFESVSIRDRLPALPPGTPLALALLTASLGGWAWWRRAHQKKQPLKVLTAHEEDAFASRTSPVFAKRQILFRYLAADHFGPSSVALSVERIMTSELAVVKPEATRDEVCRLMSTLAIRHVLVCDENESLVGVISDRDVAQAKGETAQALMTPNPTCVTPDSLLLPTITLLVDRQISCVPVIRGKKPLGVLTTTDLLLTLQCLLKLQDQSIAADLNQSEVSGALEFLKRLRDLPDLSTRSVRCGLRSVVGVAG
jgi:predicted transcriptional regulator/Flp pilus assembly pilin Flp